MKHKHTYDEHGLCFECDKPMPNPTTKERVRKFRAKAKEGGLVRFECYVTPEQRLYLKSKVAAMKTGEKK